MGTSCGACPADLWPAGGAYLRNLVVLILTATSGELSSALETRTTVPPQNQHLRSKLWLAGSAISILSVSPARGMSSGPSEGIQRIRMPVRLIFSTTFMVPADRLLLVLTRHSRARLTRSWERCSRPSRSSRYRLAILFVDAYMNTPSADHLSFGLALLDRVRCLVSHMVISTGSSKANISLSHEKPAYMRVSVDLCRDTVSHAAFSLAHEVSME